MWANPHLGSTAFVTDTEGELYEHVEYFAFGETWVSQQSNTQRLPYLYTSKELDEETGLYYFGARYYDPRTSVWQSADPALPRFLNGEGTGRGVFAPMHLNVYAFSGLRPLVLKDPNGEDWTVGDVITAVFVPGKILAKPVEDSISEVIKAAPDLSRPFTATGVASGVVQGVAEQVEPPVVAAATGNAITEGSADIVPAKKNDVGIPLGKGLVRTFAFGMTFVGGGKPPCVAGCFVAGTLVETENGEVPIEQIRVGDRVEAGSTQCASDHFDPDARTIALELPNPTRPTDRFKIQLVRSRAWLTEHTSQDGKIWFEIPELDAGGWATVTATAAPPPEKPGRGCLVLMTVEHVAGEMLRLHLADGQKMELTPTHPLYFEGRGWTAASDIGPGDLLRTESGTVRVESAESARPSQRVYNIEVGRQHAYRVSASEIWAHNGCEGAGRSGGQARLRQLANDPNTSSADRGWIKQEINAIQRGQRPTIRNPPGKQLAHTRGREAAKGYDHLESPSKLQDTDLHRTQHKYDNNGRLNKERP